MCIPGSTAEYDWCTLKARFQWLQNCKIYDRGPAILPKLHLRDGDNMNMLIIRPITVVF